MKKDDNDDDDGNDDDDDEYCSVRQLASGCIIPLMLKGVYNNISAKETYSAVSFVFFSPRFIHIIKIS